MWFIKLIIETLIAFISSLLIIKYNLQPLFAWLIGGLTMWLMFLVDSFIGDGK